MGFQLYNFDLAVTPSELRVT